MSISQNKDFLYLKLAFRQAEINLGSTSLNPSVGCIVVRNNSVISSGRTSFNGRPEQKLIRYYYALDNFLRQSIATIFKISRGKKLKRKV